MSDPLFQGPTEDAIAEELNPNGSKDANEKQSDTAKESSILIQEHQVDEGWIPWLTVAASWLQFFCCFGVPYAMGVYVAEYRLRVFSTVSESTISFIGSTNFAACLCLGIFIGRPCEVYGLRVVVSAGGILSFAGLMGASFCKSIPALIATQGLLAGIGGACLFIPATAVPAPWFRKKRSLAMGIASTGGGFGGIAFSYINQAAISSLGYQWSLRISALMVAFLISISLIFTRTPKASTSNQKTGSFLQSAKLFRTEKWLIPLYLASLFTVFGYSTPIFYGPTYIETEGGASGSLGSTLAAVFNIGLIVGRICIGWLGDTRLGITNVFLFSMILGAVFQLVLWLPANGNIGLSFAFAFLYGVFGCGYIGLFPVVLSRHLDFNKLASITGLFFSSELPGQLVGSPISGAILARANYKAVIGYSGGIMLFGSLFAVLARFMIDRKVFKTV